jgi:hypothetical protein
MGSIFCAVLLFLASLHDLTKKVSSLLTGVLKLSKRTVKPIYSIPATASHFSHTFMDFGIHNSMVCIPIPNASNEKE